MSLLSPFGYGANGSGDYLGKTEEEYFQDYLKEFPLTVERLDSALREFFIQGFNDGLSQGLLQGFSEGSDDKANEIVQYMLRMKVFTIDQIVEATQVEKEEVLWIQKSIESDYNNGKKGGKDKGKGKNRNKNDKNGK